MSPRLEDAELTIRPGDSIPVRAAKVSLKTGRRLKRADDPAMVKIITERRTSSGRKSVQPTAPSGHSRGTKDSEKTAESSQSKTFREVQDLLRGWHWPSSTFTSDQPNAILIATLGGDTVMQSLIDEDEMRDLFYRHILTSGHVEESPASEEAEAVEHWQGRTPRPGQASSS